MHLPKLPGLAAENCTPPLGISEEAKLYLASLKEGERVIECGISGMTGRIGTVYINDSDKRDICVRWDAELGELGQMGTSVTWGSRRFCDAGTFREYAEAITAGPDVSDGCDSEGFEGGCTRAGHTIETCRLFGGFQIGDTIMFSEHHLAAGDTGVIVGRECWLNNHETTVWNGVGAIPARVKIPNDFSEPPPQLGRFLVRLLAYGKPKEESLDSVNAWRDHCLAFPHNYPYVTPRDMRLVSRVETHRANDGKCHGAVLGVDVKAGVGMCAIASSEEEAIYSVALRKAATQCLPLHYPPREPGDKIKFLCHETTETKVAEALDVGFTYWVMSISGRPAKAIVFKLSDDGQTAEGSLGGSDLTTLLKKKDDGWYDQHIIMGGKARSAITKLNFGSTKDDNETCQETPV